MCIILGRSDCRQLIAIPRAPSFHTRPDRLGQMLARREMQVRSVWEAPLSKPRLP